MPTNALWSTVDRYLDDRLIARDDVLDSALAAAGAANLPAISVSPAQGKLLMLFAKSIRAARVLEIGTLAGYSTIWLARGLVAGGKIVTLEYDPKHAEVARRNFARAGVSSAVEVRVGAALETLPALAAERPAPFDLVFIDADKANTPAYFDWALQLTHAGSLIITDNVVRDGKLVDADSGDANIRGMRAFIDRAAGEARASTTVIQTVGSKGYDGFALSLVL
jgi:predicted O-methyltransferase YrrM